jgi:hypothetical protein
MAATGYLRTDVITLLVRLERRFEDLPADALRGLMFEVLQDPAAANIREHIVQSQCTDLIMIMMGRAAARGEIDPTMIRPRIAGLPKDLIRNEYLTRPNGGRVPEQVIAQIVDEIFLPLVRHCRCRGNETAEQVAATEGGAGAAGIANTAL